MSNRIKVLALAAIAVVTAGIVWTATSATNPPDQTSPPPTDHPSPTANLPSEPATASYRGLALGANPPASPTGRGAQSMLWIAAGSWWAAMIEPKSRAYHIYQLVDGGKSWADTGSVIDERSQAQPDTLWDEAHGKLYILTGTHSATKNGAARLIRYSFDSAKRRFVLDPNFPVLATDRGFDSMVLGRDSTGILWMAYLDDSGQVTVKHSSGDDLDWSAPAAALPAGSSRVTVDDAVRIVSYGPGQIGVLWTSRAEGTVYFAGHADGAPYTTWSPTEVATQGRGFASDQVQAAATPDGRVFVAVATALGEDPSAGGQSPGILVLVRTADGNWSSTMSSRLQDQQGSPVVIDDPAAGVVYVTTTTPKPGGAIVYKRTLADQPSFDTGTGTAFIADPTAPKLGDGTTTKQPVGPETGVVMLAWDPTSGQYIHGVMDLGRGVAAGPPRDPAAAGPQIVVWDDFNPWPLGPVRPELNLGWVLRSNDRAASFRIVAAPSRTDRSAALVAPKIGDDIRACKAFPETATGTVTIDVRSMLPRQGASDAVMTEVRGPGFITATVRFGKHGTFAYFRGQTKVETRARVRARVWYHSIVTIHLASRTYDWRLTTTTGRVILAVRNVPWRQRGPAIPVVDSTCLRTPVGGPGIGIDWNDYIVRR